jgi:hypothetical protein
MQQPSGFEYYDDEGGIKSWVCSLDQALYGLRDSAFLWNEELDKTLYAMGFEPLDDDPCVYKKLVGAKMTILMLHVNDFIIAAPSDKEIEAVVAELNKHYPLKDLGEPKQYLGCLLERDYDAGTIRMSQKAYVQKILYKADMLHCKGRNIPLPTTWN